MEDLLEFLFAAIVLGVSLIAKARKGSDAKAQHQAAAVRRKEAAAKAEHPYAPEQPEELPAPPAPEELQVLVPTVHTHVQPDCETHDAPSGSLNTTSAEGKDPCHEAQLTHLRPDEEDAEEAGLTFDWSGENMVKAFVMQEILTRPAKRYAR